MKNFVLFLTILLFIVFSGIAVGGAYMVYMHGYGTKNTNSISTDNAELKVQVKKDSTTFEITNAIPELVIFLFGVVGLIAMLFKIPLREVLLDENTKKFIHKFDDDSDVSRIIKTQGDHATLDKNTKNVAFQRVHLRNEYLNIPVPLFPILLFLNSLLK